MNTLKNLCIKALRKKILDLATIEDMLLGYDGLEEIYFAEIMPIYMDHNLGSQGYDRVCEQKTKVPCRYVGYRYNDDLQPARGDDRKFSSPLDDIPLDMKTIDLSYNTHRRSYSSKYTPHYQTLYDTERKYLPKIPTKMYNALYNHM
jgi:hypothetical protein